MKALACAALAVSASVQAAVVSPYANDFSATVSAFTATSHWTLGGGLYSHSINPGVTATAGLQVTDLGGSASTADDFSIKALFNSPTNNGTGTFVSVFALGSANGLSGTYYAMRQMSAVGAGGNALQLVRNGTSVGATGGTGNELRDMGSGQVEFTLAGVYVDTNADTVKDALDLTATFYRVSTSSVIGTLTYRDLAPVSGNWFGMSNPNASGNGIKLDVNWDSVSIVPEPAAVSLIGTAGLLCGRRRGRRA